MIFYLSLLASLALLVMREYPRFPCPLKSNLRKIVTYRFRASIIPRLPSRIKDFFPSLNHYTPLSFSDQIGAGLSSNAFDIEANVRDGDSRAGLDERGAQEVKDIMRREGVK